MGGMQGLVDKKTLAFRPSRGKFRPTPLKKSLLSTGRESTQVFAEAQGADALLERGAMAMAKALKERFELEGAGDVLIDFDELTGGEFFPTRADGSVVTEAAEEKLDLGEGEAHIAGETDEEDAMQSFGRVAALAAEPLGRGEEATLFVVTDGGGVAASAAGELTDFHDSDPEIQLDLKLTLSFSIEAWDVANPNWRKAMKNRKEGFMTVGKKNAASVTLALSIGSIGAMGLAAQGSVIVVQPESQMASVQSKFYCNSKALTPEQRARHKQLTEKLMTARKEIVETEKGYEFQYSPADVSLAELAEWVAAESKCCPFFDFHIDLEREGKLVCLRLTGEEGIKAFIRAEFKTEK
jgi:hypothetical protein